MAVQQSDINLQRVYERLKQAEQDLEQVKADLKTVALTNAANVFTEDQEINKISPVLTVREAATDVAGRLMTIQGQTSLNYNLWWDGSAWHSDDPTIGGLRYRQEPTSGHVWYFSDPSATPNPLVKGQLKPDGTLDIEGDFVTAGAIKEHNRTVAMGEWQSFATLWEATGTAPSLGNGTLDMRYALIGTTCHVYMRLAPGSMTTYGTGIWSFTLPVAATTAAASAIFAVRYFDGSTVYPGVAYRSGATKLVCVGYAGGFVGPTVPFTWASGNDLILTGTYEIA